MAAKDGRMNNFTEAINSIKVVKLMSWKKIFIERILNFRNQELNYIKLTLILGAFELFLIFLWVPMMRTMMFMFFMLSGQTIELAHAFVAIAVMYALYNPIMWIPQFIGVFIEFMVSMKRIQKVSRSYHLSNIVHDVRWSQSKPLCRKWWQLLWMRYSHGKC